jgi:hypothetical protein
VKRTKLHRTSSYLVDNNIELQLATGAGKVSWWLRMA